MQIEQTFRDLKSLLGLEREKSRQPWRRVPVLLWAVMIGMTLDLLHRTPLPQAPRSLPRRSRPAPEAPAPTKPLYRAESATREGLHALLWQVVLGVSPLCEVFRSLYAKSQRMAQRPQVQHRRRAEPALRHRERRRPCNSPA